MISAPRIAALSVLAVIALWLVWPSGALRFGSSGSDQIAAGRAVYVEHCAKCHGQNLEGQPNWKTRAANGRLPAPPHDETGHTWHHSDDQLFRITKFGLRPPLAPDGYESDMPAYENLLDDDEIRAVLAYIKSTWPDAIRRRHADLDRAN